MASRGGSRLDFDVSFKRGGAARPRPEGERLRLLVIADLRGAARPADPAARPLSGARVQALGLDSFDEVFAGLAPAVQLSPGPDEREAQRLSLRSLADFHPDQLYDRLDVIQELRASRARLTDPQTFDAERARLLTDAPAARAPVEQSRTLPTGDESTASTLGRLLGGPVSRAPAQPSAASSAIDSLLQSIVKPHVKAGLPEQTQLIASVDSAIGSALRGVLHDPAFQRLEASWRALDWLVRENALGDELEVWVLDASRAELIADLRASGGNLEQALLYRLVVEQHVQAPGGKPFAMVIGDLYFDGAESDVGLLAGLGALAAQAGGSFIAGAAPSLVGCRDLVNEAHWSSWEKPDAAAAERMSLLRQSPVARFIGLALPRLIGRVPYGKRSDPIERFDFSELEAGGAHEHYLWINPAFGCAQLMAAAFAAEGWDFALGSALELSSLPLAAQLGSDGERIKPCAEVCLDASTAERMLAAGLMPLLSYRDRNAVRLLRFQSIAEPPAELVGPFRA